MNNRQTNKPRNLKWFHPNVPESVRSHLLGEKHSPRHKFFFGTVIIYLGVSMVKASHLLDSGMIQVVVEGLGHIFGGVGVIPVVKAVDKGGTL